MAVQRARGAKFSHVPWVRALGHSVYMLTFNGVVDAAFVILNCAVTDVSDSGVEDVDVVHERYYPAVECGTRELTAGRWRWPCWC